MSGPQRAIGSRAVWPIGLGGAQWTFSGQPERASTAVIHAALDAGVTLVDTARAYTTTDHPSSNEALLARALADHPRGDVVLVATKGGHFRAGEHDFPIDGRPSVLRSHVEGSLRHLRRNTLSLYLLHWPDPNVPLEESVGALSDLRDEGKIEMLGLSNVSLDQVRLAQTVTTIQAVQNRLSLLDPTDADLARTLSAEGIAFLAHSPLGGPGCRPGLAEGVPGAATVAERHGVSVQQVALAWLLRVAPNVIPIVGATRPVTIADSAAAATLALTADDARDLDHARDLDDTPDPDDTPDLDGPAPGVL